MGVKKPQEAQKSNSPLENEGSQGCRRRIQRFTREDNMLVFKQALKCVENSCWKVLAREVRGRSAPQWRVLASSTTSVGEADMGGRLAPSDGSCVFTHCIHGVECAREVRAAW